jgi:hypothetical protein
MSSKEEPNIIRGGRILFYLQTLDQNSDRIFEKSFQRFQEG